MAAFEMYQKDFFFFTLAVVTSFTYICFIMSSPPLEDHH